MDDKSGFDIHATLKELHEITAELKQMTKDIKVLREQKKEKEQQIISYLKEVDRYAIKYKNLLIYAEEKPKKKTKKKVQKREDIKKVLKEAGIADVDNVYAQILEQSKGEDIIVDSLRMRTTTM